MGLTFQQRFYHDDGVFLLMDDNIPVGILEVPDSNKEIEKLKECLTEYKIVYLDFDELIINGYKIMEKN